MSDLHGSLIWYELITPDTAAAADFYRGIVGWAIDEGAPETGYRMMMMGDAGVGGMLPLDDDMAAHGMRPMWLMYVGVDDVDASAASAAEKGAKIIVPPRDIPGIGRFALLTDPQDGLFYIMKPIPPAGGGRSTAFDRRLPGRATWNELRTSDLPAAMAFYQGQFGWTSPRSMSMGPAGDYLFLANGEDEIGAAMGGAEPGRPAAWRPYFRVADIDVAADSIRANGGTVDSGPHEVPGGERVIMATDPTGAFVGFVA